MLFYLDKDLAKQSIAKCIAVSEKMINEIELEERKEYFQVKEVLIYEGNDIPHKFKFNESLNTIEEFVEVIEDPSQTLSEDVIEHESDFDESVEIDSEKQYFYIDKEYADKYFKSQIIAVFEQPLKKPAEYFQKEVYQHYGKDIPYYITVEDNTIREATEYEKYKRSQRKLEDNEVVIDSKKTIVSLAEGQYVEADEVVTVHLSKKIVKPKWNKELHIWQEEATQEEIKEHYFDMINKFKTEILQVGFDFNSHQQKCREKDLALLGNAIAANEDAQPFATIPVTHWSFDDNDVVEMSLEELKKLRIDGATFVQAIFTVEAQLKASSPNVQFTKQDFISKINEISEVKCYENI